MIDMLKSAILTIIVTTLFLAVSVLAMLVFGCTLDTGPTTIVDSSSVSGSSGAGAGGTEKDEAAKGATIELVPPSAKITVGTRSFVKVVVSDAAGQEIKTEQLSVAIADSSIATFDEIAGRTIAFLGVSAGYTTVVITANEVQAVFNLTVAE